MAELWSNKAEEESGKSELDHSARLFLNIQSQSTQDPELRILFDALVSSIKRYENVKRSFISAKTEEFEKADDIDKERIRNSDERRRIAHEALVSSLDALSRAFRKDGLNNEWRREIGLDRDAVAEWADHVSEIFPRQEQEIGH